MAGGSTSEEMDAFDDVTPAKPVSIYDLDEDMPTRAQSSDEIAEFQQKAREKREAAFRSFAPPTERRSDPSIGPAVVTDAHRPSDPGSGANARPVPRESGPVRIDRLRVPPPHVPPPHVTPDEADVSTPDLDDALRDVAATLERLPPAPRVPRIEQPRGSLETIGTVSRDVAPPVRRRRWPVEVAVAILITITVLVALTFFR
jgi:hypothetical protein